MKNKIWNILIYNLIIFPSKTVAKICSDGILSWWDYMSWGDIVWEDYMSWIRWTLLLLLPFWNQKQLDWKFLDWVWRHLLFVRPGYNCNCQPRVWGVLIYWILMYGRYSVRMLVYIDVYIDLPDFSICGCYSVDIPDIIVYISVNPKSH